MAGNESSTRPDNDRVLQVADWYVVPAACRIERDGKTTRIEPRMMAVLEYLAARPGEMVTRRELEDAIWSGTVVVYKTLTNTIIKLRKALKDPHALESYYRGEDLLWRSTTKLEMREAQRLFEETIHLEPQLPVGYAAGALTYWAEAISGLSDDSSKCLERATELARDVIRLDDVTGYAHIVMAHVHLTWGEFDEAMAQADQAVSDRPSCPTSYAIKASILTYLGRAGDAIEFAQYALRLTPVHPPLYPAVLASAYCSCDRYEEAVAAAQTAIHLEGNDITPYLLVVAAHAALGRTEDAQCAARKVLEIKPEFALAEFAQSQPYKNAETLQRIVVRLKSAGLN
ncbi:MAG: winged helix-turn-helix domain-containing protein [Gammaproteobacteria bacterium]|nr:winged helix-turn-helix domain-containing protein [Gammaproteobacteria bacterium]